MHHNEQEDKSLIQKKTEQVISKKIEFAQYHSRLFSYLFDRQLFGKTRQRRLHIRKCREPENVFRKLVLTLAGEVTY